MLPPFTLLAVPAVVVALNAALPAAAAEPGAGPAIWPFQLGLGLWTVVVVVHGFFRVRRGGHPDRR